MSNPKKKKTLNIKDRWEIYKAKHPVLLFILKPLGKFLAFVVTVLTIYLTVTQGISTNLGNSIARASFELQKLQLEKPFFSYAYSSEASGIVIKHNENINIIKTTWVFPTSSTIEKYDDSGDFKVVSSTTANLRLYEKFNKALTLHEFYRGYQEDLQNFPEINQSVGARVKLVSYMLNGDDSSFGYLRCHIFPTIQNNEQQMEPGGVLIGVSITYERLDGKIGYTNDILLIRETVKKVPEITVYSRNTTEQVLRSKLASFYKKFYTAIKTMPFDENFSYTNGDNCTRTGWMYMLVK